MWPMLVRRVLFAGAALALLPGCGEDEASEWDPFVERAQEVRELALLFPVPFERMTSEEYAAEQEARAGEIDDAELEEYRATYGRLGYFGPETDLRADLAGSSSDWVAGVYDHRTKDIRIIGDPDDSVIVHEVVHALQDQHFALAAYFSVPSTTDEYTARRAVVEGDATLAQSRYILQEKYEADLNDMNWPGFFSGWAESSAATLEDSTYPAIFRATPAFLYPYGTPYCAHNLTGAHPDSPDDTAAFPFDWGREDALFFEGAPLTTEQIMKFDATDAVVAVGVGDVPDGVPSLTSMYWDTLGAWYSYLLFYPLDGAAGVGDVKELAARWDGDRALFVEDTAAGEVGVVWSSVWDDDASAQRVETALQTLHGFAPSSADSHQGTAEDGEDLWIERRGIRVVLIKNVDPSSAPLLADAAFAGGAQPKVLPPRTRLSLPAWIDAHRGRH